MNNRYLSHNGIPGQQWYVRNGPPYPLDRATHNRVVRGKQKSSNYGSDKVTSSKTSNTSDTKKLSEYVTSHATNVNPSGSLDNCKEVAMTIAENIANDVHNVAPKRQYEGSLLDMVKEITREDEHYLRNGVYKECYISPENGEKRCSKQILSNWSEGAVGMIGVKTGLSEADRKRLAEKYGISDTIDGHVFNWVIENGKVKYFDGQQNNVKDAIEYFDGVADNSIAEIICYDNSGPRNKKQVSSALDIGNDIIIQNQNHMMTQEMIRQQNHMMEQETIRQQNEIAIRESTNAALMTASLGMSGGTNPFVLGMM